MACRAGVALVLLLAADSLKAQQPPDASPASPPKKTKVAVVPPQTGAGSQSEPSMAQPGTALEVTVPIPGGDPNAKENEVVIAPVPFRSLAIGWGLVVGAGYLYHPSKEDKSSPAWITAAAAGGSENGTWFAGIGHKMNLAHDRWRLSLVAGYGHVKYDFFVSNQGDSIPLDQRAFGGFLEGLRGIGRKWYAGLSYTYADTDVRLDTGDSEELPPSAVELVIRKKLASVGPTVNRDTRDDEFYPRSGAFLDGTAKFYEPSFGGDVTFQDYSLAYNRYLGLGERQVLALRGYARVTRGDTPFFAEPAFGSGADLRGYTPGLYRDDSMATAQAEYRLRFTARWGAVAFAGVGAVGPKLFELGPPALPSVGLGLRYVIAKENNLSFRLDYAWGKSDKGLYIGVGEAF